MTAGGDNPQLTKDDVLDEFFAMTEVYDLDMRLCRVLLDQHLSSDYLRYSMNNNYDYNQLLDHGDQLKLTEMELCLLDMKKGIGYLKKFLADKDPEYKTKPLDEVYDDILATGHAAGKNNKER